jgi:hypothetical protein
MLGYWYSEEKLVAFQKFSYVKLMVFMNLQLGTALDS